jgi:hypothetical protein
MSKQAKLQNSMQKYTFYKITQKQTATMTSQSKGRRIPKITIKWAYDLWWLVRTLGVSEKDEMVRNMCTQSVYLFSYY